MILIFFLFFISNLYAKSYRPVHIKDDVQYYYSIPASDLVVSCDKALHNYCNCSIDVKPPSKQTWIFRKPMGKEFCLDFKAKMKKIFKQSKLVEIFGYGSLGELNPELLSIGAIRDKKTCWDWLEGDCSKF